MSWAIAPTSTTAHWARAAGAPASSASSQSEWSAVRCVLIGGTPPVTIGDSCCGARVRRREVRQPALGLGTHLRDEPAHALELACASGDDGELRFESAQVELAHRAAPPLLHEEQPRAGLQLIPQQAHLALGEPESPDEFGLARLRIRKEDLRRRLLDER